MDPVHAFDATGETGTPGLSLAPGVYFWRLRNRVEGVPDESPSPVWEFVVVRRSAMVDTTWGTLPDLNGDGIGDMVVPAVVVGSTMPVAYVYLGTRGTLPTTPTQTLRAPAGTTSIFGRNAAIVPDINGDGFADLVVGRFGSVLVYHGSALGLSVSPTQVLNSVDPGRNFGASVAGLGDVNGDGYGDVVVGATAGEGGGRAYVYWGGAAGLAAAPDVTLMPPSNLGRGALFGETVTAVGDFNGDGSADVLVSASNNTGSTVCRFFGRMGGLVDTTCGLVPSSLAQAVRWTSAIDDFDGDGLADYANGRIGYVSVTLGVRTGEAVRSAAIFAPTGESGSYGASVGSVWDVDGDGRDELAVGAPQVTTPGRVYVYRGSTATSDFRASWVLTTTGDVSGYFGREAIVGRDVNGDGLAELLVSSSQGGGPGIGRVYFYPGGQTGYTELPAAFVTTPGGVSFGEVLACRSTGGRRWRLRWSWASSRGATF